MAKEELKQQQEQWQGPQVEAPQSAEVREVKPSEIIEKAPVEAEAGVAATLPQVPAGQAPAPAAAAKTTQMKRIESVLEEDLGELYFQMDEAHRKLFKEEGEKTARAIDQLVSGAKATAQKILYLIQRWLRLIPGINKFFLEQEAKIKTDKLIAIASETRENHKSQAPNHK